MQSDQVIKKKKISSQEKLAVFENRWKFAVFPAMIAFFMLSAFGFYLIYGMLERMQALSEDIDHMTKVMAEALPVMQGGVVGMSAKMQWVGDDLDRMSSDMRELTAVIAKTLPAMEGHLIKMSNNINQMAYSTAAMAATTDGMGRNIWDMNRNISKPMSFFSDMMPWQGSNISSPPPGYRPAQMPNYRYPANRMQVQQVPQTIVPAKSTTEVKSATVAAPAQLASVNLPGMSKYNGFCASCHGRNAEGGVGPDLRHLSVTAISDSLYNYKSGRTEGTMTGVVKALSDTDIDNIAEYLGKKTTVN